MTHAGGNSNRPPSSHERSDTQLLTEMRAGNAEAWKALHERYLPSAWRYAWHLVGDRQIAEDLVSESLLALCRSVDQLDAQNAKVFGWLRGVIRHKAIDHYRGVSRAENAREGVLLKEASRSIEQPSTRMETQEQTAAVLAILDDMDDTKRLCLEWKYLEHRSIREIAAHLNHTEKAVESILYRARIEFRERFTRLEQNNGQRTEHRNGTANNHSTFPPVEPSKRSSI